MREVEGQLVASRMSLQAMNPILQVTKTLELKALQQRVNKARERQECRTMQLDEFQYINMQLVLKAVDALQAV